MSNQQSAFPILDMTAAGLSNRELGMTLRDYFAAKAMAATLAHIDTFPDETWRTGVALDAYRMADAMLAVRDETGDEEKV